MRRKNKSVLADELPIVEEDWNFSGIPREELRFAEIYEYSREIKLVRDAFTEWLDSEAWMVEYFESQDHSIGIEPFEETFGFGCSNRELIATLNIQGKYSVPGFGNVGWESIGDEQPDKLAGHRLSAIVEMLSEWPKPYKSARQNKSVKLAITRRVRDLSARSRGDAVSTYDPAKPAGPRMGEIYLNVRVDCSKPKKIIEEEFGRICEPFLSSRRGRKKKGTPPSIRLKQLAAYRLQNRFVGKGKPFPSFAKLAIEIQNQAFESDPHKILPNYASESGFSKASDLASLELKNYRHYLSRRPPRKGERLGIIFCPDQFATDWDEASKYFLKKLF